VVDSMETLLAVDVGLKTGLAMYGRDGRLIWYRSRKLASPRRLRRVAYEVIHENPGIAQMVIEGGGPLADIWLKEAERREIPVLEVCAEAWRKSLLYPRQQRSGPTAKKNAKALARRVIEWSKAPKPHSLRHDAAEAILIGFWAVQELGWQEKIGTVTIFEKRKW